MVDTMLCQDLCGHAGAQQALLPLTCMLAVVLRHDSLCLQLYDEMGSRHRVRPPLINIIKTATVPNTHCKRDNTKQFHQSYDDKINKQVRVKFPLTRKLVR